MGIFDEEARNFKEQALIEARRTQLRKAELGRAVEDFVTDLRHFIGENHNECGFRVEVEEEACIHLRSKSSSVEIYCRGRDEFRITGTPLVLRTRATVRWIVEWLESKRRMREGS